MSKKEEPKQTDADAPVVEVPKERPVLVEPIDEYARDVFVAMGHAEPFSPVLVDTYNDIKRRKDIVYPGRMSVETLAIISFMCPTGG